MKIFGGERSRWTPSCRREGGMEPIPGSGAEGSTAAVAPRTVRSAALIVVALAIGGGAPGLTTTSAFRPELRSHPLSPSTTRTTRKMRVTEVCGAVGTAGNPRHRGTFGAASFPFAAHIVGNEEAFRFGFGGGDVGHTRRSSPAWRRRGGSRRRQRSTGGTTGVCMSTATREDADATATEKEEEGAGQQQQPLSDVDAQVLLSMLEDDPDLVTERKIRRMLKDNEERKRQQAYRRANGGSSAGVEGEKSKGKQQYASKFFQELASEGESSWWNSLKTKAAAAAESIGILLINKIERDLQLSFALGGFFAERAKRDATRALKAAKKRRKLALSEKSSYDEEGGGKRALFLSPAVEDDDGAGGVGVASGRGEVYDELNTPMDEIRQVTRNIQEIFASASSSSQSGSSSAAASAGGGRTLGSLLDGNASRSERSRRTYARRKRRALARERESLPSKVGRFVTTDLVDGTWQLTSEMKTEEAGYRTKRLREGISKGAEVIGALTGGAVAGAAARLSPGASSSDDPESATRFLGEGSNPANAAFSSPVSADESAAGGSHRSALEDISKWKKNLVANLCFCLEEPDQTWLVADVLGTEGLGDEVDKESLEAVVTKMVQARDILQGELSSLDVEKLDGKASGVFKVEPSPDVVKKEMESLRDMVLEISVIARSAVGPELSSLLQNELIWDLEFLTEDCQIVTGSHVGAASTMENKEAVKEMENVAATPSKISSVARDARNRPFFVDGEETPSESPVSVEVEELEKSRESTVPARQPEDVEVMESLGGAERTELVTASEAELVALERRTTLEVLDATAEYTSERINVVDVSQNVAADVIVDAPVPSVMVEVMGDEEIDDNKFKAAESVSEETPKEESFPVTVALRSLDVVFFIAEKIFTVALPGMFSAAATASSRLQKDRRNGLGSDGWEQLENARGASRRY